MKAYLDNAATTGVSKEVFEAMKPYFSEVFGNPSAIHKEGVEARSAIEEVREKLARTLRVRECHCHCHRRRKRESERDLDGSRRRERMRAALDHLDFDVRTGTGGRSKKHRRIVACPLAEFTSDFKQGESETRGCEKLLRSPAPSHAGYYPSPLLSCSERSQNSPHYAQKPL